MRKKVRIACITGQNVPGHNVLKVWSAVSAGAYTARQGNDKVALANLVQEMWSKCRYYDVKPNAIIGLSFVYVNEGTSLAPGFLAYGNPAYIQPVAGVKGDIAPEFFDVEE